MYIIYIYIYRAMACWKYIANIKWEHVDVLKDKASPQSMI